MQKRNYFGIVLIILIIIVGFWFFSYKKTPLPSVTTQEQATGGLAGTKLFSQGLASEGITADQIGFHDFSPNGKYFLFTAFKKSGADSGNIGYLLNIDTGAITKLPGMPERGIDDDRVVQLYSKGGIILYWLADGSNKIYPVGDSAFKGSLSPDGKTYLVNTNEGIKKIDIDTGTITTMSISAYDSANAWFSDSKRILGYRATGEDLAEAGKARELGIWNTNDSTFTALGVTIPQKTLRDIEWVKQDSIARVNAGYDDGSFDYLVDVNAKTVVTVGETSGALMGGIKTDKDRELFAVVGGDDQAAFSSKTVLYKGTDKKYEHVLPAGYFRESMQIVNESELLYVRKHMALGKTDKIELVDLDLKTGEEKVVRDIPVTTFTALSLAPDHNTYVLSSGSQFIIGTIK